MRVRGERAKCVVEAEPATTALVDSKGSKAKRKETGDIALV